MQRDLFCRFYQDGELVLVHRSKRDALSVHVTWDSMQVAQERLRVWNSMSELQYELFLETREFGIGTWIHDCCDGRIHHMTYRPFRCLGRTLNIPNDT